MLAEECLDTDAKVWIAPNLNIDKRRQNEELMALYIEKVAGKRSAKEAKAMWAFSTGDRALVLHLAAVHGVYSWSSTDSCETLSSNVPK